MPAIPFRAEVHGTPELATIELHGDVNAAAEARLAAAYREVAEIGAGAVLLDAFVLRTVLVPSMMHLFKKANWWLPAAIDRRMPHLSVEPQEAEDEATS